MKRILLTFVFLSAVLFINATSPKIGADPAKSEEETNKSYLVEIPDDNLIPLADQFFAGDGSALTAAKWGPEGGPYTSSFVPGNVANFNVVNGTGTGASIMVGGFTATENFTLTAISGTLSNLGNGVVPINVSAGKTLDFAGQSFTSSSTAGYNFSGPGVLAMAGNTYGGGFTLNSGTVIVRGVNGMGGGASNTLTINGGTIASNANRDFTGKYNGGISIAGDFQLGALAADFPLSVSNSNLTFSNNVSLGAATRSFRIGADGTYTFSGIVSGGPGSGLTVTNAAAATGTLALTGIANTYNGPTTLSGGILSILIVANGGSNSSIGASTNAAANLVFDGGTLRYAGLNASTNRNFTINSGKTATIDVTASDLTISGAAVATDGGLTKSGLGLLNLSGTNLYTGDTVINPGGALALLGGGSIASSQVIEIKGGAFFDVSVAAAPVSLASGQVLRASGTAASGTIATQATRGLTTAANSPLVFTAFNGSVAPLTIQGAGTVTLAAGNPVTVNTTTALAVGDYTLINKGPTGTVAGTAPTSLTIGGSGLAVGTAGSLVITGGQLVLRVTAGDAAAPVINYTNLSNTASAANRVLTATISDNVAVASGAVAPRIYFRKNAGAFFSTQCSLASGNTQSGTYNCTIDNSLMGGVAAGDQVSYFVIAQDTSGNLASNPVGAAATSVNDVTIPPPTPNAYALQAPTAAEASIAGRIATAAGRGIGNISVSVSGGNLAGPRLVTTSAFGYYRINGLRAGESYVVSVAGKSYVFDTPVRVVTLGEDALDIGFVGRLR